MLADSATRKWWLAVERLTRFELAISRLGLWRFLLLSCRRTFSKYYIILRGTAATFARQSLSTVLLGVFLMMSGCFQHENTSKTYCQCKQLVSLITVSFQ